MPSPPAADAPPEGEGAPPDGAARRLAWAWAFLAGAVAFLAAAVLAADVLGSFGGDSAEYVMLAKALRAGEGYTSSWGPGPPTPHTLYPPLLPLLLVPFVGATPPAFTAAHVLLALAGGVAVALLAVTFHRRGVLGPAPAALGALAAGLSPWWLRCSADLLSELPSMAFAAGAFLALSPPGGGRVRPRRLAAAAACAAAAFLTRTSAVALVVPVAAALVFPRRERGPAGTAAAVALATVVAGWFAYGGIVGGEGGTYDRVFGGATGDGAGLPARALAKAVDGYLPHLPSFLLPWGGLGALAEGAGAGAAAAARTVLGGALWVLAATGAVAAVRRRAGPPFVEGFFVLHLALVCVWPFDDTRFGLPLAPLLALLALEGGTLLATRAARGGGGVSIPGALPLVAAAGLCLPNAYRLATVTYPRAFRATPRIERVPDEVLRHRVARLVEHWDRGDAAFAIAGAHDAAYLGICDVLREDPFLPAGAVLATNPRVAALLTGRKATRPDPTLPPAEALAAARRAGVRLLLVDGFSSPWSEAIRRIAAAPGLPLSTEYALGPVTLVRVD